MQRDPNARHHIGLSCLGSYIKTEKQLQNIIPGAFQRKKKVYVGSMNLPGQGGNSCPEIDNK